MKKQSPLPIALCLILLLLLTLMVPFLGDVDLTFPDIMAAALPICSMAALWSMFRFFVLSKGDLDNRFIGVLLLTAITFLFTALGYARAGKSALLIVGGATLGAAACFLVACGATNRRLNQLAAIADGEERIARLTEYHRGHRESFRSMVLLSVAYFESGDTENALQYNQRCWEKHHRRVSGKHICLHNKLLYSMVAEKTADVAVQARELEQWRNDCAIKDKALANSMGQILILARLYLALRNRDLDEAGQWVGQIDRQSGHWPSSLGIVLEAEYHCRTGNRERAAQLIHTAREHAANKAYQKAITGVEALLSMPGGPRLPDTQDAGGD